MSLKTIENIVFLKNLTDRTGRVYNKDEMLSEISKHPSFYGIIGHEYGPLSLDKVSHVARNLRLEGNDLIGDIDILNTPMGNILFQLMEQGIEFQTSMRAIGVVNDHREVTELTLEGFNMEPKASDGEIMGKSY